MSTKQLIALIICISVLAGGLAWWLQRFEMQNLHAEIGAYLSKFDEFRQWEAGKGGSPDVS